MQTEASEGIAREQEVDRMETEQIYLGKFREYILNSNRYVNIFGLLMVTIGLIIFFTEYPVCKLNMKTSPKTWATDPPHPTHHNLVQPQSPGEG